jgi:two-component system heavy metal sensor histidine kinase CusS
MMGLRPWTGSIVARMTAWYAGSALVLILAATGFLYWVLATSFDAEDRRTLTNTVTDLRLLLRASGELRLPEAATPAPSHSLRQPQEIWVRIVDTEGRTLLESSGMEGELPAAAFPPVAEVEAGHDINGEVATASGRLFQVLSARALADPGRPDGRVLQVAMDRAAEELLLVHYRERLWFVVVVSVVLCSAIGYAIARRGIRPIERVTTTARRVRSSTLHERIDTTDLPAELRALAATFNEMLDRLEESFEQISQFSADVAHELRTPISNLRGELEVALGKDRPADEYRDVLGSALEECVRISRVIQSLLFLARAETATGDGHHDTIQVRQEVEAVLDFYEAAAADAGVALHVEGTADFVASFDRTLFQQAVGNLVANAIAHTPPGGQVTIRPGSDGVLLRIEVADTGRGIAPEHLPHVFDRFYRADRARSGSSGNLGLGLAMVRSIATLHGGRVAIISQVGQGTRVTLEVPLTRTAAPARGARQLA